MTGTQFNLSASIGFRHVIEDGIRILAKRDGIDVARKKFVVDDLVGLLSQATRGSEVANQNSLLISTGDKTAVETYSFLDRFLSRDDKQLQEKLRKAQAAFKVIADNAEPSAENQTTALELLNELLASIERRGASEIPEQPENVRL